MGLTKLADGTFQADPYDLLGIVRNTSTGRFHVTIWLESPLPSQGLASEDSDGLIRLKSMCHHTKGAATFEEALEHLKEMRKRFLFEDVCVWNTRERLVTKDFGPNGSDFASVLMLSNWRKGAPQTVTSPEPEGPTRLDRLLNDEV
jgi:hypothetical protein